MAETSNYTVRPITAVDEPFLWEMLHQAIYVPEGAAPRPREMLNSPELARYVRDWGQPDDFGFIAVDEQSHESVGAVWLRLMTKARPGYGYIDDATPELSIAVLPPHRGRGVGTRLMKQALDEAGRKHAAVSLSVSEDNPAIRLYRRIGFETVADDGRSVIMKKEFNATSRQEEPAQR